MRSTHGMRDVIVGVATAITVAIVIAAPTAAQTVVGHVTEEGTGQPLPGTFIVLVDEDGVRHEGVLSNSEGRYILRASQPGSYRLAAELIGYATSETGFIELVAGRTETFDIEIPVQAVMLDGISVQSEARCQPRPGSGPATAELWDEARKALEVTRWGEQQEALNMRIMQYSRELSPNAHSVREASQRSRTGYYDRSPYVSRPAEELDREGYIQEVAENEYDYFAPDAQVLLSETFLNNHCFRVVEPEEDADSGLVGLAFEPMRGRDQLDIEGVLWINEATAELRRLDFRYSELPFRGVESREAGGRVEFQRLANGMWIVNRWRLRMPLVAMQQQPAWRSSRPTLEVVALNEIGAEVQRVTDVSGNVLAQAEGASLYGVVWDSVAGDFLPEARVTLAGADRETTSAADGTYRFSDLPSGTYEVAFSHPNLEVLGLDPTPRRVALESGRATRLVLSVPGGARIAEAVCADTTAPQVFVFGQVMDPSLTWPVRNAVVRVDPPGGEAHTVTADDDGIYRFCTPPHDDAVRITAFRPGDVMAALASGAAQRVASAGKALAADEATTIREDLTVDAPTARVTATWSNLIHGKVLEERSRDPVEGASVTMLDSIGQPIVTVVSDEDGNFQLTHPGFGNRFQVRAEHIAYSGAEGTIAFGRRDELNIELLMSTRAIELEPIVVVERRRDYLAEMGYYFRKDRGMGHFIERIDIERHRPTLLTDIVRRTPGVKVWGNGLAADIRMMGTRRLSGWQDSPWMGGSGTGGMECMPSIYVDGAMVRPGGDPGRQYTPLNEIIQPEHVEAIEVYRRASEVPARYTGSEAACGVVAVWTTR